MYIKILGAILTIISSTAIGFCLSGMFRCRLEELKEIRRLILMLRGEIRYTKSPLPEALSVIGRRQEGIFGMFFKNVAKELNNMDGIPFKDIWNKGINNDLQSSAINNSDKAYLKQLGDNLGYLDVDMQLNIIDLYISQLELQIRELETSLKEKSRLYNCLGIMGGILITIVII